MNEVDSTGFTFTTEGTTVDQRLSRFENGIVFPDGSEAWGIEPGMRGYTIPQDEPLTETIQAKAQEQFTQNLRSLGIAPDESTRLRFVRRAVVISYGPPEEVPAWL